MNITKKQLIRLPLFIIWLVLVPIICMAGQKLHIDDPMYRFSGIVEGVLVSHTFKIQNIGDATLRIEDVMPP